MPRRPPHFKVMTSAANHEKLREVWGNNDLLALWLRLGVAAIERFADRTKDVFIVHDRELPALSGKHRADVARTWLRHLADVGPISAERESDIWRITFPNFAKKQGFVTKNGVETEVSASASASASASKKKKQESPKPPPAPLHPEAAPLAQRLCESVRKVYPGAKTPERLAGWTRVIDLMLRRDGRDPPGMRRIIDWLENENPRSSMPFVVQSAQALREKYDRIRAQMERSPPNGHDNIQWPTLEQAVERLRSREERH